MNTRLQHLQQKIVDHDTALQRIQMWKLRADKVVFTNGCFDLLHTGHVCYLAESSELGNRLIVALNTDSSLKRQGKGADRPVNKEVSRATVLAALGYVDLVVFFDKDTPLELINFLKPDIIVKGADYDPNEQDESAKTYIVGSKEVRSLGGSAVAIPLVEGFSTTGIIAKLKS